MELLVTMLLAAVVGTTAVLAVRQILTSTTDATQRSTAVNQAQLAVDQIARQVRSGNVLYQPQIVGGNWRMRIYTQANGLDRCVEWQVSTAAEQLQSRAWPSGGSPLGDWRVVASNVVNNPVTEVPFTVPTSAEFGGRLLEVRLVVRSGQGDRRDTVQEAILGRNTFNQLEDIAKCGA